MSRSSAIATLMIFGLAACTDAGFKQKRPEGQPPPDETVVVEGVYCASDSEQLVFPVKILFVLDDSGSMGGSDPNFRRLAAAQELVSALLGGEGEVYFGVEKFQDGNSIVVTQPTFTQDAATLQAALAQGVHAPGGNTPYVGALSTAVTALRADVDANPTLARRTRYIVLFLSDGVPTDDNAPYGAILNTVNQLKGLENGSPAAGTVTLHTAYLADGENNATAINLLMEMAQIGGGEFRNFENGDEIDFSDFDVTAISRDYRTYVPILVTNMNTRLTRRRGLVADSDADGIPDFQEAELGTDPSLTDTDGDSCTDLTEWRYAEWDPLTHGDQTTPVECSCSTDERGTDSDGDGLSDCDEKWLSLDKLNADSDINSDGNPAPDNMVDHLEVLWNLGRTKADSELNYDADAVSNFTELATHMDPNANDDDLRKDYAYVYEYIDEQIDNPRCYDFRVTNIHVVNTLAAGGRQAGDNWLRLYFVEAPQDNPFEESNVRVVDKIVQFNGGSPSPDEVGIVPEDFHILGE